jgi:C4-dicarboxylate-specific signal transduction histidine kinase
MRIKVRTTITTYADLPEGATLEQARNEILARFENDEDEDEGNQAVEQVQSLHSHALYISTTTAQSVEHCVNLA